MTSICPNAKNILGNRKKKIFVAMSGGVDSSVAAALLKKQNFDVCGVFIKGYYPKGAPCTWRDDRRDAMRVAAILDIPFYTFDFSKEYKKHVIDYMIREYKVGRTPNPDIMCNKYIKFDLFLKKALAMGADKIATGHYVRLKNQQKNQRNPVSLVLSAKDENKDQSYFLWALKQKQLKHCLFPIGDYLKSEVRALAEKFKLPVAQKKDSQGLCFVGEFKMEDFLKNYIKPSPGIIVDENGRKIGGHQGARYYTIGQRHGVALGGGKEALFVVKKDIKKNILVVAPESKEKNFYKKQIKIKNVNWISGFGPDLSKIYSACIRYRQPLQKCKIFYSTQNSRSCQMGRIEFDKPQKAVAPGQSLVLYDKNRLLGGGIIV